MAETIRRHKRLATVLAITLFVVTFALIKTTARAVDVFELDGNALDDPAVDGVDWNTVNSALAKTAIPIPDPEPLTTFTGGGSKDDLDITKWKHKTGSAPPKDEITNAYAVAYNQDGQLHVYFGADRFANDGDAHMGFWFFQQEVAPLPDGSFSGSHSVGDLLVIANFSNGGAVATIELLRWVGTGGDQGGGTLQTVIPEGTVATCVPGAGVGTLGACAISNVDPEPAPWSYQPAQGPAGTFPTFSFFEGGVNITQIFQGQTLPCFSSFLAETRSSTSVNATLKDFVSGSFPVCGIEITKACGAGTVNPGGAGFDFTFTGTVTNTGFGLLHDVVITDDNGTPANLADDFTIQLAASAQSGAGQLAGQETKTYTGTIVNTTLNPPTNGVKVTAALSPGGAVAVSDTASDTCDQVTASPTMSVSKLCSTELVVQNNLVVVKVNISGQVCNTSTNLTLSNVTVVDDPLTPSAIVLGQTTLGPTQCTGYSSFYFPSASVSNPSAASFSDTVTATGQANLGFGQATATATATCPLCPPCTSPNCPTQ